MTTFKTLQKFIPLLVVGSLMVCSAPAFAETEGTGWEAFSNAFPTNLLPGRAADEIREFKISGASGGEFRLTAKSVYPSSGYTTLGETPFFPYDATHEEVQKGLEAVFGAGNVVVSGGGMAPYRVTFTGSFSDQYVEYTLQLSTTGPASGEQPVLVTKGQPDGEIEVDVINVGAKPSEGPITVTDALPAGLTATKAGGIVHAEGEIHSPKEEEEDKQIGGARWVCTGNGFGERDIDGATVVTCTSNPAFLPHVPYGAGEEMRPMERIGLAVKVEEGAASGLLSNGVTVAGGGAQSATSVSDPVTVDSSEPGFGFSGWDVWFSNADGRLDTQAGSHPYAATFALHLNTLGKAVNGTHLAGGEVRNIEAVLPPGFFGDPGAVPRCTRAQLDGQECPASSQIGIDIIDSNEFVIVPVFNMVPPPGVPDEFALSVAGRHSFFDAGVRSGSGYGIVEHIDDIPSPAVSLDQNILTVWGVPAEASHDAQRLTLNEKCQGGCPSGATPQPFLTLPTSCAGPQPVTIRGLGTWQEPSVSAEATVLTHDNLDNPVGFTGCEHLSIEPSLSAVPDTGFADTPAGLTVEVKVPQENLTNPEGVVAATLKNTSVTLPEGVVINPGQAAGLVACGEAEADIHGEGPQSCPSASKVGTVKIQTPLLEGELESELEGSVYVLRSNPPELKLLIAASGDGIYLKLPGTVHLNEATGQLTTTFDETPELPFTDLRLSFSGGAQAALATPTQCGIYTTNSDFTPWTSPFAADVPFSSSFPISSGPGGSPCASPLPFSPSLIAGATTDQAGGFTNFSLLLQRGDGQQRIDGLRFKAPEGLTGELSKVPLCTNAQAETNTCPAASKIGYTVVESGPGPYPLVVPEPGQEPAPIYLTESYEGAPFGLSIVVPLNVGPFTLPTQRVRAKIEVNPLTTQLTVTTNPFPQEVAGVPTDLREVDAVIERPEFMINPTNCEPSSFSGTAYGTPPPGVGGPGVSASIGSHFQVGACRALEFKPKFSVSTSGKTSKADGASLTVRLSYPNVPQGTDADIARVKVELPKALPSRLTTLQKACSAAQFEANPAGCPADSIVGHAKAMTPLIPVPLEGPAYFVSHGGEAFPSLIIVLQGYGVTVDLVGSTFINEKTGVTSSTFKTVPDAPVGSFELTLPKGRYSALAANANLCKAKLAMPTEFLAQNGAEIHQSTKIAVTGCPKAKKSSRHKKKHAKSKHK
jgi:hypothetical protein